MMSSILAVGSLTTWDRVRLCEDIVVAPMWGHRDRHLFRPFCSFLFNYATFHAWDALIQSTNLSLGEISNSVTRFSNCANGKLMNKISKISICMWINICIYHFFCHTIIIHHKDIHSSKERHQNMKSFDAGTKTMSAPTHCFFIKLMKKQCTGSWVSPRSRAQR